VRLFYPFTVCDIEKLILISSSVPIIVGVSVFARVILRQQRNKHPGEYRADNTEEFFCSTAEIDSDLGRHVVVIGSLNNARRSSFRT
jgi:hypothetical protein